jgi:hypothetical protein
MLKIVLTSLLLLSALQAKGIFSTLPYKIKLGEELPPVVQEKLTKTKIQYQVNGKFVIKFYKNSKRVESVIFPYGDFDMELLLPRVWRNAGLELSYEYSHGTPYKYVRSILRENGARSIEEIEDQTRRTLIFTIDGTMKYELVFYKDIVRGDHGKGLAYIIVTEPAKVIAGDEYY